MCQPYVKVFLVTSLHFLSLKRSISRLASRKCFNLFFFLVVVVDDVLHDPFMYVIISEQ